MSGYAVFVTAMWVMWIIENGYKARKTRTQAKRIRHLESLIKLKDQAIKNYDDACVIYQGGEPHEELAGTRGPIADQDS